MSYLWKGRSNPKEWCNVSTWSNKTGYRSIFRYGTVEDKLLLKEPSNRNKGKKKQSGAAAGGGPKRKRSTIVRHSSSNTTHEVKNARISLKN